MVKYNGTDVGDVGSEAPPGPPFGPTPPPQLFQLPCAATSDCGV